MIRSVTTNDSKDIANIYNEYITNSVITFETKCISVEEIKNRIETLCRQYPFFVFEENNRVTGYCYVHPWKEKAAYSHTFESTIYIEKQSIGKGIGLLLMAKLIDECRKRKYHSLIACITDGNETSIAFHRKFNFTQVSHFKEVGYKFNRWIDVKDFQLIL